MATVFLSYRRQDSADVAGRLRDRLAQRFGEGAVFTDVDSVPLGVNFVDLIREKLGQCEVFVALIGPDWIDAADQAGNRRLDDPNDFVRIEIESALNRGIPLIPVLVRGAAFPPKDALPETLQRLAQFNGLPLRADPDFHTDAHRLIAGLEAVLARSRMGATTRSSIPADPWEQSGFGAAPRIVEYLYIDEPRLSSYCAQILNTGDKADQPAKESTGDQLARPADAPSTHAKIHSLLEHLSRHELVAEVGSPEERMSNKAFFLEAGPAAHVIIPPKPGSSAGSPGLRLWIALGEQVASEEDDPAASVGATRRAGPLYLLEDSPHGDDDPWRVSAMSSLHLLTAEMESVAKDTVLANLLDDEMANRRFAFEPLQLLSELGARIGAGRRIHALYRVRAHLPVVRGEPRTPIATFGYPIFIAEAHR